ncbi:divisome protein SepX/GlpR [Nocardia camponoti]|uniref:Transmembrane protein n=1 Tax=Nocardia camponoti TaxID=1616106 RepID=A0A917QHG9_9NOCA|nr:gephyrin-like molybdotransferase receptor GlpR [Nocardia camponoti]GGK49242.1 hypothetical protein GCM10011591_20800 [Nocardia camponoti]
MPNSILWIGLVVLWVFVLFPIMADRHPRIRRTTDAALATRVLHRGDARRRIRIGAGSHDSDPDYRPRVLSRRPHRSDSEDSMTTSADDVGSDNEKSSAATELEEGVAAEQSVSADVDESAREAAADESVSTPEPSDSRDASSDEAKSRVPARLGDLGKERRRTVDDPDFVPDRRGRGGFDPEADAMARAARYTFRQRAVLALVIGATLFAALGLIINAMFWWACGLSVVALASYLAYLRKQVTVEEEIRRRRAARLHRGRYVEGDDEEVPTTASTGRTMDRDTARALRRRSTLLDSDDEDPMFRNLPIFDPATARAVRNRVADLDRAVGE